MSLSSYIVNRLHDLEKQWALAVRSLPEHDLVEQRNVLRDVAVETLGKHQAEAMVLKILNAEINRRHRGDVLL